MFNRARKMIADAFSLNWDTAPLEEIQETIISGAKVKGTNLCILLLAILIASIGLNMNSTAVIIGAMLISPLMGGIMAIGYGIATNDLRLSRNAALGLAFQVVLCVVTSMIYFTISPISTACSELLARTKPTLWDVLIAVFGGLAGIIGVTRKERGNVIPGVAIATALMPPLCTAGYGLATQQYTFFFGAIYLFFINSFFICLGTILVVRAMHIPCKQMEDKRAKRKLHVNITLITIVTVLPSIYLAYTIVSDGIFDNNVKSYLENEFSFANTQIVQSSVDEENKIIEVAVIGKTLSDSDIQNLQHNLNNYDLKDFTVQIAQTEFEGGVTQEQLQQMLAENNANQETAAEVTLALKTQQIDELTAANEELTQQLTVYQSKDYDVEEMAKELLAMHPEFLSCSMGIQKVWSKETSIESESLLVTVTEYENLPEEEYARLEAWLKAKYGVTKVILMEQIVPQPEEVSEE